MKAPKTSPKKQVAAPKTVAVKRRIVRKSAKVATEKAAYEAYVRDHERAYRTLADIEKNTLSSMRSIVEKILAERAASPGT
jgi:hypothetical protein